MPKQLKDILQGVKSSKKGPLSIGKDPGVDYKPKAGDEDKFVAKHEIEDHRDRVGNEPNAGAKTKYDLNFSAEKRHGHKKGDDKKVYEAKKAEDMQCNHSAKGVVCPVHGMAECYDMKTIKEESAHSVHVKVYDKKGAEQLRSKEFHQHVKDHGGEHHYNSDKGVAFKFKNEADANRFHKNTTQKYKTLGSENDGLVHEEVEQVDEVSSDSLMRYRHAAAPERRDPEKGEKRKAGMNLALKKILGGDELGNKPKVKASGMSKKEMGEDVELDEVLTKSTSAGETIKDFEKSDAPQFKGKSKEKRKQMALAAYYKKQNEETIQEAVPRGDSDGAEEMVKSELKALANKAMHLAMAMPQGMHVEPWVQAKIAQAKSYVSDVHDYMIFGDHPDEEDEQAPADTPMTFPSSTVDTGRI
jgi:hypothetical protein